ncbi:metal-dependent transcriptional regulator [Anaerofustis stercorihominis]|uniref:Metal-dependent transcriptional regulator n=1 Tax=Anaerofustis stercorihominis TaxID=214853 RepID=A0A3E3DY94_9FIRM|nr:metal-dependent transcriptional regulator [Anaerofustis stercorihominis]RGD74261.1 metal-dependent transcriptional regulator [Anaerofustis stercorihominis]
MKTKESQENYLETILILQKRKGNVRSIDIANELDFSRPSVSRAIKLIKEKGYITVDESGLIKLTEEGKEVAGAVYEKHVTLGKFLITLGVEEKTAMEDACRMEHVISTDSFEKIKAHAKKCMEK